MSPRVRKARRRSLASRRGCSALASRMLNTRRAASRGKRRLAHHLVGHSRPAAPSHPSRRKTNLRRQCRAAHRPKCAPRPRNVRPLPATTHPNHHLRITHAKGPANRSLAARAVEVRARLISLETIRPQTLEPETSRVRVCHGRGRCQNTCCAEGAHIIATHAYTTQQTQHNSTHTLVFTTNASSLQSTLTSRDVGPNRCHKPKSIGCLGGSGGSGVEGVSGVRGVWVVWGVRGGVWVLGSDADDDGGAEAGNILTTGKEEPQNIANHNARTTYLKFPGYFDFNGKCATTNACVNQSNRD